MPVQPRLGPRPVDRGRPERRPAVAAEGLEVRRLLSTYYVDASAGSDQNAGTSAAHAWQSLAKVSGYTFAAGDQVLLKGTFAGQSLSLPAAAAGVTVDSYGGADATITGTAGQTGNTVTVAAAGVTLADLVVTGTGLATNAGDGVAFLNGGTAQLVGATVRDVTVSGYGTYGVYVANATATNADPYGWADVTLAGVTSDDNGVSGIQIGNGAAGTLGQRQINRDVLVDHCTTYGNAGRNHGVGHAFNGGIFVYATDGGTVQNCTAYGNCYADTGGVGIWTYASTEMTFQYDESYANTTAGYDGDGFDLDWGTTDSTIQYCYSHDNDGSGFLVCTYNAGGGAVGTNSGNTVRYDVAADNGNKNSCAGVDVYGDAGFPVTDLNVYNNTVLATAATSSGTPAAVRVWGLTGSTSTVNVLDNVLYTTGTDPIVTAPASATLRFQGNDYWNAGAGASPTGFQVKWGSATYTTAAAWRAGAGVETLPAAPLVADPQLVDEAATGRTLAADPGLPEFKLAAGSPAIGAGQDLTRSPYTAAPYGVGSEGTPGVGTRDFFGDAVPQGTAYDVGADQTTPTVPPTVPTTAALPAPWASADIGAVGRAGTAAYSAGTFTVTGCGADIFSSADAFQFVSQAVSTDATVSARVGSLTNTSGYAKAGVMFRAGTAAGADEVSLVVEPDGVLQFQYRTAAGHGTNVVAAVAGYYAPAYVELVRAGGTTFDGYVSADGSKWTSLGGVTVPGLSGTVQAGLAVCSHNAGLATTATFSAVAVTPAGGFTVVAVPAVERAAVGGATVPAYGTNDSAPNADAVLDDTRSRRRPATFTTPFRSLSSMQAPVDQPGRTPLLAAARRAGRGRLANDV